MDTFQIFIKNATNGKTYAIDTNDGESMNDLKEKIRDKSNVPIDLQILTLKGKHLNKKSSNIEKESTIHLTIRKNFERKDHPYLDISNNFINDMISIDSYEKVVVVIPGSKIGSKRNLEESHVDPSSMYVSFHDIFRQQLPLPILKKAYEESKNVHIFLFDSAFELEAFDKGMDIREILSKIEEPIVYDMIELYVLSIHDVLKHIKLKGMENIDYKDEIFVYLYIIPFTYDQSNIDSLQKLIEKYRYEYHIYLKNIPHSALNKDSYVSNASDQDTLIKWHGHGGGSK